MLEQHDSWWLFWHIYTSWAKNIFNIEYNQTEKSLYKTDVYTAMKFLQEKDILI